MSDAEVETLLFRAVGRNEPPGRTPIDWVRRRIKQEKWRAWAAGAEPRVAFAGLRRFEGGSCGGLSGS